MASSYDRTYRVRGIPGGFTEHDTRSLLSSIWDSSDHDPRPTVHSLAPDPYSFGHEVFNVATVTFKEIPQRLLDCQDEWTLLVPGSQSAGDDAVILSLTIDNHFRGFTPLNTVKDHKIEFALPFFPVNHPF
jgi:hypothetical protein